MRLAILASGRGSHLRAVHAAIQDGALDARLVGVFSDKAASPALAYARDCGLHHAAISSRDFNTRQAFDAALFAQVDACEPDLVLCAGFMRILSAQVIDQRPGRLINVHPSLLPKYPGLHTHQRAIEAGDREHGASVHVVTATLDAGPVLAQTRLAIEAGDDPERLAARLLPLEHRLVQSVLQWIRAGRFDLRAAPPTLDGRAMNAPLQVG